MSRLARIAWYRFAVTFSRRRGGYIAIVLLLGVVGGISLGSLAGARETQGSYSTYLASTHPEDLQVFDAFANPALGFTTGFLPGLPAKITKVPYVRRNLTVVGFDANIDYVRGARVQTQPGAKPPVIEGPYGSEYLSQNTPTVLGGRMYDPANPHEAVINAEAARQTGLKVGSVFTVAFNSDAQLEAETATSQTPPPFKIVHVRVVGLVIFSYEVVADQYDQLGSSSILFSPALTHELATCCATYSYSLLKLDGGAEHLASVERDLTRVLGQTITASVGFQTNAPMIAIADRAIKPISIALGVFGGLAALAALIIVSQVVGRQLRLRSDELDTMRALGADPVTIAGDTLVGVLSALVIGALLAAVAAVMLSPLFPLGPVRPVYAVGVKFDWTVLGLGFGGFVVLLSVVAVALVYRLQPHRVRARAEKVINSPSAAARVAAAAGLSAPAVTGVRFALDPRGGRERVPVRSAILGGVLAVAVVMATVTFGASLNNLVTHPSLYGWKWDYTLLSGFSGDEDLPGPQTAALLAADRHVSASSGAYFVSTDIDGQRDIPTIGMKINPAVAPPVLNGHGLEGSNQIVLGAQTMASLHKKVGDSVTVGGGGHATSRLVIVGTATMPAIMGPGLGIGAIIDYRLIPPNLRNTQGNTIPGPNAFFIRTRGAESPAALASLQRISNIINTTNPTDGQPSGGVITVLKPTEIVNSHSIEAIPAVLGAGLAVGAVAALGITLVASVRRRRHDLAVLKTLGFASRQLATVVAWQATVAVTIATVIGVPLGIVSGRLLWDLFANQMAAVPAPTVPVLTVAGVALGAIVLGNLVAALPGRLAARTSTALLLRAE